MLKFQKKIEHFLKILLISSIKTIAQISIKVHVKNSRKNRVYSSKKCCLQIALNKYQGKVKRSITNRLPYLYNIVCIIIFNFIVVINFYKFQHVLQVLVQRFLENVLAFVCYGGHWSRNKFIVFTFGFSVQHGTDFQLMVEVYLFNLAPTCSCILNVNLITWLKL